MRNFFYLLCSLFLSFAIISCNSEEGLNTDPNFRLSFSVDTLSFDTLFTGFGSTTMQFKVYNRSSKKVNVEEVYLQNINSPYRLNVNGVEEENFADVEIGANDSLYVFVEVDLIPNNADNAVLLEDVLVFNVNKNLQGIVLSTWAQDVILVEEDIAKSEKWTGNRPYLVDKQISIAENTILTLEKGTKVYFKKNAGLDVYGNLLVEGNFKNKVYFGSSRLEELYENVPGQWNGIYIHGNGNLNKLSHFILEDGINGIKYQNGEGEAGKLDLEYGIIRNFTQNGISVTNVTFEAHDLLLLNCGDECLKVENGDLNLYHSTLYNFWNFDLRTASVIGIKNSTEYGVNMANCIVWGSHNNELMVENTSALVIENSLLKLSNSLQQEYSSIFTDCIFNENPEFISIEERIYSLANNSPCINTGKIEIGEIFPVDLQNKPRNIDEAPDMGAYEFKELEE